MKWSYPQDPRGSLNARVLSNLAQQSGLDLIVPTGLIIITHSFPTGQPGLHSLHPTEDAVLVPHHPGLTSGLHVPLPGDCGWKLPILLLVSSWNAPLLCTIPISRCQWVGLNQHQELGLWEPFASQHVCDPVPAADLTASQSHCPGHANTLPEVPAVPVTFLMSIVMFNLCCKK